MQRRARNTRAKEEKLRGGRPGFGRLGAEWLISPLKFCPNSFYFGQRRSQTRNLHGKSASLQRGLVSVLILCPVLLSFFRPAPNIALGLQRRRLFLRVFAWVRRVLSLCRARHRSPPRLT